MSEPTSPPSSTRPWLAAVASAIIPGVGQFLAGDSRRGRILLVIDVVILASLIFLFRDKVAVLTAWIQPTSLALMMVGNILLFGYRIWAADDAYRTAKGRTDDSTRPSSGAVLVGALGLAVILLMPHVVFGYYDLIQYDLITSVFSSESASDAGTSDTTPRASSGTAAPANSTDTSNEDQASATPTTEVAVPVLWDGLDRLNILLIGGDFGQGRTGIRTDTMITVSIDPESGEAAMFSVPRNWTQSPLPNGMGVWDCECYPELINELWVAGEQFPDNFPGPGTPSENAVKGVISEFLGIPIHYFAMVNLDGFVDIVDALGGVDIFVPSKVVDEEYPNEDGTSYERIEIDQGMQHLDGHLALAYSRTRNQDSDYFRMNRQRCVIEAMMEQANPTSLLLNFGKLADVVKNTVTTDIPIDTLPALVELIPNMDMESVVSVRFIPPEYHLKYRDDGKPGRVPNIDLVHEHVDLVLADPVRAIEELGLEKLENVCGDSAT